MNILLLSLLLVVAGGSLVYPCYMQFVKKDHHARGVQGTYFVNMIGSMIVIFIACSFAFFTSYTVFILLCIGALFLGAFLYGESYFNITETTVKVLRGVLIGLIVAVVIVGVMNYLDRVSDSWIWWLYYSPSAEATQLIEMSQFLLAFLLFNGTLLLILRRGTGWRRIAAVFLVVAMIMSISFVVFQVQSSVPGGQLASDEVNDIFMLVLRDPLVQIIAAIMTFGGLLKAIDIFSAEMLSKVILIFIPSLIWVMTFIGLIPVPEVVITLFVGFEWFGWFFYVFLVGLIFVILISMINLFSSLPTSFKMPT